MAGAAHTLNCLMCGAPASTDASNCSHCGARLATVACPACFGMIFQGSRFCPLCGARADRAVGAPSLLSCSHCRAPFTDIAVGKAHLCECAKCQGLWVDTASFDQICVDREHQAAVLGPAVVLPPAESSLEIRYIKCPQCQKLMNRVNFAGCSGVIVDVCKQHGTWFDAKELQRIVQFIRAGGLDQARAKEKAELERARRRLQSDRAMQAGMDTRRLHPDRTTCGHDSELIELISAVGEILQEVFHPH